MQVIPITTTRALSVEHTTIPPFWPLEECGLAPSVLVNGEQITIQGWIGMPILTTTPYVSIVIMVVGMVMIQ